MRSIDSPRWPWRGRAATNRVKRAKKTHHEGREVHEERKLTTKGENNFQSEISETFVAFVLFVVSKFFADKAIHRSPAEKLSTRET
jgi:hypothetical protein